ncbi:MAG: flagellar hook-length control protein FliK [Thiohalophilus sp.]|uniref:flagellar hook-length control protein FliK n=1 Tax=Thiohalophilus sp. TaxID=3028392 RepID=UPI00286FF124|nr:flagellar hook-length control protein FliK [Thiohalophilus sp.]MDR9436738.1 flagellar hook-length control protein FliK [Thiohalophilus sp.]
MEIKGPGNFPAINLSELRQLATRAGEGALQAARINWQNGQLLNALVVRQDSNNLLLDVQGQPVLVKNRPEFAFLPGQKLTLQVEQLTPQPAMKLVAPAPRPVTGGEQGLLQQTLRQDMGRQTPLPPLLANLKSVAREPQQHPPLPAPIRKMAWELHQLLPDVRQASRGESLQQALERTGPFLHHQLGQLIRGQAAPPPEKTLQGALLRLADQIRQQLAQTPSRPAPATPPGNNPMPQTALPASSGAAADAARTAAQSGAPRPQTPQPQPPQPPTLQGLTSQDQGLGELLRQVEGGLGRMQLHQLHSLQAEQAGRPMWAMELPIRSQEGIDLFDLRIRQEESDEGDGDYQRPWNVSLAFDLEGLGPVRVNLTLIGQTVSARFQMQEEQTRSLFDNALDQLRSRLHGAGLDVGRLECANGIDDPPPAHTVTGSSLLDEKV